MTVLENWLSCDGKAACTSCRQYLQVGVIRCYHKYVSLIHQK